MLSLCIKSLRPVKKGRAEEQRTRSAETLYKFIFGGREKKTGKAGQSRRNTY